VPKIILVPPYRAAGYDFKPDQETYYLDAIASMRDTGLLDDTTIDIDPGAPVTHVSSTRDESVIDQLNVNTLGRIRAVLEADDHDAIVVLGAIDVAFHASRMITDRPVVHVLHASVHMASLVGTQCSLVDVTDPQAERQRRLIRGYGFDEKVKTIRVIERSSTDLSQLLRQQRRGEPVANAGIEELLDQLMVQCRLAVDTDQVDTLIIGFTPIQALDLLIRERLDREGYGEIQVVWPLTAAVAVAKALIGMKLTPAKRAFPTDALVKKPAYR
jgi:Asp/Glu/hydantoin racemase